MPRKDPGIQYGPNVKPSPNSQGTLFRGVKPVDQHRYQRGFTPERKDEVDNTVRFVGPPQLNAQARDVIARSTVPLHRLTRLTVSPAGLPPIMTQRAQHIAKQRDDVRYGENARGRNTVKLATPTKQGVNSPVSQDVRGQILIHEVGHHVGETQRRAPHNDRTRGAEEAAADNFLGRHFRPDPRTTRRNVSGLGDYSYRGQGNVDNRSVEFQGGYNAVHKTRLRSNPNPHPTTWDQSRLF